LKETRLVYNAVKVDSPLIMQLSGPKVACRFANKMCLILCKLL